MKNVLRDDWEACLIACRLNGRSIEEFMVDVIALP